MLFSIALSAFTGVVFGLVPALRATRLGLTGALKERSVAGQSRRFGLRNLLVVAQVAICMVLLVCSGLFLRSLYSAGNIDTGFTHRNLLLMAFDPSLNRYTPAETRRLVDRILERGRAVPGVEAVSLGDSVPLNIEGTQNSCPRAASASRRRDPRRHLLRRAAYFETFGIRMLDGEDFRPGGSSDDIVIVNQARRTRPFRTRTPSGGASISWQEGANRRPGSDHQVPHHRRRSSSMPLLPDGTGPGVTTPSPA